MSDILYRPNLDYEKNYNTSGQLDNSPTNPITSPNSSSSNQTYNSKLQDLKDTLTSIQNAIKTLPSELQSAFSVPLNGVNYMINDIGTNPGNWDQPIVSTIQQNTNPTPSPVTIPDNQPNNIDNPSTSPDSMSSDSNGYVQPISDTAGAVDGYVQDTSSLLPVPTDIFSDQDAMPVDVQINMTSKPDLIDQEYKYDMTCIFTDYLNNVQNVISKYYTSLLGLCAELNVPSFLSLYNNYNGSSSHISDAMKPMSDLVIRNQIILDQKVRMFKKIFDIDSMIINIRACKSGSELRKRYYTSDYVENDSFLSMMQNDLLSNTRQNFDNKYTDNLYNLYKYLNSSVILSKECLDITLNTCQAKAALIKNEGVILK